MALPAIAWILAKVGETSEITLWEVEKTAAESETIGFLNLLPFLLAYAAIVGIAVAFIIWRRRRRGVGL